MKTSRPVSRRAFLGQLSFGAAATLTLGRLNLRGESAPLARPLGVVLVGLGKYSSGQLGPSLRETKNCRFAGVVTGVREKGEQWAKDYGFSPKAIYSYDTMARMADNPDIDIVYVVTPNGLHAEHAIAAAKAGKHVIVEKPMANTVAECDAIIAACNAAKVKHSVGYRLHFDPYHRELMRLAKEKDFGVLKKLSGDRGFFLKPGAWRADKKLAGGGPMMDLGIYINHGACMAADGATPLTVTAKEMTKTKPEQFPDVEEGINWTMEFANGAVCEAFTSYTHTADRFRAEGAKGWIDFKEHAFTYKGALVDTSKGPLKLDLPVHQQALQMDDFAQCIRENRESSISGHLGRRDLTVIEAIYEAARTGGRVKVRA